MLKSRNITKVYAWPSLRKTLAVLFFLFGLANIIFVTINPRPYIQWGDTAIFRIYRQAIVGLVQTNTIRLVVYLIAVMQILIGICHYIAIQRHKFGALADALSVVMFALMIPLGTWAIPIILFVVFHGWLLVTYWRSSRKEQSGF